MKVTVADNDTRKVNNMCSLAGVDVVCPFLDDVINKQKHGFDLSLGVWVNDYQPLHDLARNSLSSLEKRGYFNQDYIENLWQRNDNEHSSYYGVMIWTITFEQWLEQH